MAATPGCSLPWHQMQAKYIAGTLYGMGCRAYTGLDLSGNIFPAIAPNEWWFNKLNMWHESLWFWNPKAQHGSGATPAHQAAAFADETCLADMLHSYDEHIWRPMIVDDPLTGGERMLSKPVRKFSRNELRTRIGDVCIQLHDYSFGHNGALCIDCGATHSCRASCWVVRPLPPGAVAPTHQHHHMRMTKFAWLRVFLMHQA
jgi:hypothetical protein